MNFKEIIDHRRSVRIYDANQPLKTEEVKDCIKMATLSPNSGNMQLWEFYHVTDKAILKELAKSCFNQSAARTAQQMVVFVARKDLHKQRSEANMQFSMKDIDKNSKEEKKQKHLSRKKGYYKKLMPFLYNSFPGMGILRKIIVSITGLFRPIYREVSISDMKVVSHKSVALAAQTFMLAMASKGYDTCPMEGFDSKMVKKILNLPRRASINMIIACGIRGEGGIYEERFRVPFEEVYFER